METLLVEYIIRTSLIAAVIGLVLLVMRIKAASVLHAAWTSVVLLMMLLPVWMAWGPKARLPVLPPEPGQTMAIALPVADVPVATPSERSSTIAEPHYAFNLAERSALGGYLLGLCILLIRLAIGTVRANRLTSASCVVPVTVGWLHPRIILPECSHEWSRAQLDVISTHEGEHVRRRDPLFQWIALLNRALFWFHPLAWWLERRLSGLAEEACDAAVLAQGYDPHEYSEYLLNLARSLQGAGTRIDAIGMAMPGIGLRHRILRMLGGVTIPRISRARMAGAVAMCAAAAVIVAAGTLVRAQQQSTPRPAFEVATIKENKSGEERVAGGFQPGGGYRVTNYTLRALVAAAYLRPQVNPGFLIAGGPKWVDSDRFDVEAKAAGEFPAAPDDPSAPRRVMLQTLLADRFQLKVHHEAQPGQVYTLMFAKPDKTMGPHLRPSSANCTAPAPAGGCVARVGPGTITSTGMTLGQLVGLLPRFVDRAVVDETGLTGRFDLALTWTPAPGEWIAPAFPDGAAGPAADGPSLFTALREQLGLKLQLEKGSVDMLVIDHAEKPSEN